MSVQEEIAAFDALEGTFFDVEDNPENLSHGSAREALEHAIGRERYESALIVQVDAWKPLVVSDAWKETTADRLVEVLLEMFDDEDGYGDPDEGTKLASLDEETIQAKARELVDLFLTKARVWRCEEVGSVDLSPEAVRAIAEREGWEL